MNDLKISKALEQNIKLAANRFIADVEQELDIANIDMAKFNFAFNKENFAELDWSISQVCEHKESVRYSRKKD